MQPFIGSACILFFKNDDDDDELAASVLELGTVYLSSSNESAADQFSPLPLREFGFFETLLVSCIVNANSALAACAFRLCRPRFARSQDDSSMTLTVLYPL